MAQIAYALGFSTASHFTAQFLGRFGVTPSAYRAAARPRDATLEVREQDRDRF